MARLFHQLAGDIVVTMEAMDIANGKFIFEIIETLRMAN